jgi:hypothetical protein
MGTIQTTLPKAGMAFQSVWAGKQGHNSISADARLREFLRLGAFVLLLLVACLPLPLLLTQPNYARVSPTQGCSHLTRRRGHLRLPQSKRYASDGANLPVPHAATLAASRPHGHMLLRPPSRVFWKPEHTAKGVGTQWGAAIARKGYASMERFPPAALILLS